MESRGREQKVDRKGRQLLTRDPPTHPRLIDEARPGRGGQFGQGDHVETPGIVQPAARARDGNDPHPGLGQQARQRRTDLTETLDRG